MPKNTFVDFKAVKAAITMEGVLEHYGLRDKFKKSGDNLSGPCPIHKGANPTQFRVSVSKNIWNCFSECKHGGNTLDFIARMDNVSIHAAAQRAIQWFNLDSDAMSAKSPQEGEEPEDSPRNEAAPAPKSAPKKEASVPEKIAPNPILKFRLDKLDRDHPYLAERGLTPEAIEHFEVGFCSKGMMAGRIAIPIHTVDGAIVGYVGRFPGEPPGDTPKYKMPPGFRKSLELFNIDRAIKEPADTPLVIVEGFFGCMKIWQLGIKRVVALMGSTMSLDQEELIRKHTNGNTQVVLILDEDDAGRAGREDMTIRLAKFVWVKVHTFDKEDEQPENMSAENSQQRWLERSNDMDVHCSTCGEPWDVFHLWHDAIFETGLTVEEAEAWTSLPRSQKLTGHYRKEFRAVGWEFGQSVVNIVRCPSCPKGAMPDAGKVHTKAALEELLGDDEDGLAATFEDYRL